MTPLVVAVVGLLISLVNGKAGTSDPGPWHTAQEVSWENETHRCDLDCSRVLDLALVIDTSGSIKTSGTGNWDLVVDFMMDIIDNFKVGPDQTHIAYITFSNMGIPRIFLNKHMNAEDLKAEILKNKEKWFGHGRTNTYEALLKMRTEVFTEENGDRPNVPNVAIVVTDGRSSHHERPIEFKDPVPQAELAAAAGISVLVVGVTKETLDSELAAISRPPHSKGNDWWSAPDFDSLIEVVNTLHRKTCVEVCIPKTIVCEKPIDLAIVVDASGSIQIEAEKDIKPPQNTNWWLMMGFIKNIIDKFTIGPNDVQIAIVTFSNKGITRVKLNEFKDAKSLKEATNNYNWFGGGKTNTWEGLNKMRTEVFNEAKGDRKNAPNVAIVITDGKSSHKAEPGVFKDPIPEAKLAKDEDGVTIFGFGVTESYVRQELEAIATRPVEVDTHETVFDAKTFSDMTEMLEVLLKQVVETCKYK